MPLTFVAGHTFFGGRYSFHFQDQRLSERNNLHCACHLFIAGLLLSVLINFEDGSDTFLLKIGGILQNLAEEPTLHGYRNFRVNTVPCCRLKMNVYTAGFRGVSEKRPSDGC